jgi:hypothetical protein
VINHNGTKDESICTENNYNNEIQMRPKFSVVPVKRVVEEINTDLKVLNHKKNRTIVFSP